VQQVLLQLYGGKKSNGEPFRKIASEKNIYKHMKTARNRAYTSPSHTSFQGTSREELRSPALFHTTALEKTRHHQPQNTERLHE